MALYNLTTMLGLGYEGRRCWWHCITSLLCLVLGMKGVGAGGLI